MSKLIANCIGGVHFKEINLTFKDLDQPILLGDDKLHIKLYTSRGGEIKTTQLTCIVLLNQDKIETEENKLKRQLHSKQVFPHFYQIALKNGGGYWLGFVKDNRNFRRYTQFSYDPKIHNESVIQLYFKDYNKDGINEHITINISMKNFNWSGGKANLDVTYRD